MISLAEALYESFFSVPNYNILIAGHENVGKTTFFEQIRYLYDPALQKEAADALKKKILKEEEYKNEAHFHPLAVNSSSVRGTSSEEHDGSTVPHHPTLLFSSSSVFTGDGVDLSSSQLGEVVVPSAQKKGEYLIPASQKMLDSLHISPTIGLNYAKVVHREVAAVAAMHASALFSTSLPQQSSFVPSLPPPPSDANICKRITSFPSPKLKPCTLTLWDVSGQRTLRGLWSNYFRACQGVIFIVDATLHLRVSPPFAPITKDHIAPLRALYREYHKTLRHLMSISALHDVPFLILGNKCDVPGHLTTAQLQDALAMEDIALDKTFYTSQEWHSHCEGLQRSQDKSEEEEENKEEEKAARTPPKGSLEAHKSSATSHVGVVSPATHPPETESSSSNTSTPSRGQRVAPKDGKEGGGDSTGDETQKTTRTSNGHSADSIPTPYSDGKSSRIADSSEEEPLNAAVSFLYLGRRHSREGIGNKTVKLMSMSARTGHAVGLAVDWMVTQLQMEARSVSPS